MKLGIVEDAIIQELKKPHDKSDKKHNATGQNMDWSKSSTTQNKAKGTVQINSHELKRWVKKPKAIKCPAGCSEVFKSQRKQMSMLRVHIWNLSSSVSTAAMSSTHTMWSTNMKMLMTHWNMCAITVARDFSSHIGACGA